MHVQPLWKKKRTKFSSHEQLTSFRIQLMSRIRWYESRAVGVYQPNIGLRRVNDVHNFEQIASRSTPCTDLWWFSASATDGNSFYGSKSDLQGLFSSESETQSSQVRSCSSSEDGELPDSELLMAAF